MMWECLSLLSRDAGIWLLLCGFQSQHAWACTYWNKVEYSGKSMDSADCLRTLPLHPYHTRELCDIGPITYPLCVSFSLSATGIKLVLNCVDIKNWKSKINARHILDWPKFYSVFNKKISDTFPIFTSNYNEQCIHWTNKLFGQPNSKHDKALAIITSSHSFFKTLGTGCTLNSILWIVFTDNLVHVLYIVCNFY